MGISKITSTGIYTGTNLLLHNTGTYNTFVGEGAGNTTMTGAYNSAVGDQSLLSNTTGAGNSAVGNQSLLSNTTGNYNSAVGHLSLFSNTTGYGNSAVGNRSLYSNTTGNYNVAIGGQNLASNKIGNSNIALGYYACKNAYLDSTYGVYIGSDTSSSVTGTSDTSRASVYNEIVIGGNAIGNGSNTMTLGHTDITDTYLRGYIHNNQVNYPTGNPQNLLVPVVASSFGSSSGYIKYANGLIMQWGYTQAGEQTVYFDTYAIFTETPVIFTQFSNVSDTSWTGINSWSIYNVTTTSFTSTKRSEKTYWLAIGH